MIRPARPADLDAALALLSASKLPTDGVAEAFEHFVVAENGSTIVGVAGLEVYGDAGLLRSVAVAQTERGKGLGGELTAEILDMAGRLGLSEVYLLTETAAEFFPRYGFRRIERADAAPSVRASAEFTTLCATSSTVMVRDLSDTAAA